MTSIKDEAKCTTAAHTQNIADLDKVDTSLEITTKIYKEGTADEFRTKVVTVDDIDYRVPFVVLNNLKAILTEKPDLKNFKVKKEGTGINTRYTVIPLD